MKKHDDINPIEIIKNEIRKLVLTAFDSGWTGPPFDPIRLARILKIDVVPDESISDARIIAHGGKVTIEYNPFQRHSRINFSIAHEIAHTLFPDYHEYVRNRETERGGNLKELELLCDIGASEILLPYAEFAQEANNLPLTMDSLLEISNKYQASLEAVFLRFAEVSNKPCGILLATFENEQKNKLIMSYFKGSSSLSLNIPFNYEIPSDSKANDCINAGWTAENIEQWNIFGNTRYKIFAIGLPSLKRNKEPRVGIFIVPEIYDEKPEKALLMVSGDATKPRGTRTRIIAQLVNSSGGTGIGFGKSMAVKWPESKKALTDWKNTREFQMGNSKLILLGNDVYVFQMLAQKGIRPRHEGEQILSYTSLKKCLVRLREEATRLNATVHMPMIGAGQAKGDWNIIGGMIYDELIQNGIDTTVYVPPGTKFNPKNTSPLTLFDSATLYEKK